MVSFAHPEQLPIIAEVCQSFALDNGAFSAWRSGKPLDFWGFVAWVREWIRHPGFDWCLAPDVIDGTEADNNRMLLEFTGQFGFDPVVPVWHLHESIDRLKRLCSQYRTVALGSSGKWATPGTDAWWERIDEVMPAIVDDIGRPWCKLHGLRMLNPEIFERMPFGSADSTNAAQNAGSVGRFGMYTPAEAWQRANVIADRIEACNGAAVWVAQDRTERALFA